MESDHYRYTSILLLPPSLMQLLFSGVPKIPRSLPRPGKAQAVTRAWYNANSALWKDHSSRKMDALRNRLMSLRPAIEDILARTGTAGLTYGIICRDDGVHTGNFGVQRRGTEGSC